MKKMIGILIAMTLVVGVVGCADIEQWDISRYVGSITVLGAESSNTTVVEGNIMAVFFTINGEIVLFWCSDAEIIDNGDGTWDVVSPQVKASGVNQMTVDYDLFKYAPFTLEPMTRLEDLNLQPIVWDDLKKSMHVAGLIEVYSVNGKPRAIVQRFYMGKTYDIPNCRVSQTAYDNFNDGKIKVYDSAHGWLAPENEDCFVAVYFMSETPFDNELMIPVIIDKVIK